MPRFGIRSLLVVIAVLGLWLSTFAGYVGAQDIRAIILQFLFIAIGAAAIFYRGRAQAFWIGFFTSMLITSLAYPRDFAPKFNWINDIWKIYSGHLPGSGGSAELPQFFNARDMIMTVYMLLISSVSGCITVFVFDRSRSNS
jgi:hypothetical protein